MKKNHRSTTLSIYRKKEDTKSYISISLKTSSETKSNLQTPSNLRLPLIVKQLISFVLTNYRRFLMFYPLSNFNIYIDLFIFLFIENILNS